MADSHVFRFPACNFTKKRLRHRRFSVNFAKFLRTSSDRTPPDECFLCLSVNFEKLFRWPLFYSTSEKLISSTSYSTVPHPNVLALLHFVLHFVLHSAIAIACVFKLLSIDLFIFFFWRISDLAPENAFSFTNVIFNIVSHHGSCICSWSSHFW